MIDTPEKSMVEMICSDWFSSGFTLLYEPQGDSRSERRYSDCGGFGDLQWGGCIAGELAVSAISAAV